MAAWTVSPDSYDVVVIGSGLPECLVAASLVKAGRSVLIIDAVDTYGTDFASFTPAALQDVLGQRDAEAPGGDGTGVASANGATASVAPHDPHPPARATPPAHEHTLPECQPLQQPLPPGCSLRRLRQRPLLPASGLRALAAAAEGGGGDAAAEQRRGGLILDLTPKLVLQAEPLVDLLVHCRCHHYLEFKAVEGGYVLQDGTPQPVPASRADAFRDKRLGLADKARLMRFISGCAEAARGGGHLAAALSGTTPLARVLAAEGLSRHLRDLVLYGVAMCDTDQEPPEGAAAAAVTAAASTSGSSSAAPDAASGAGGVMTGAEGAAALDLLARSDGRFGQTGALMAPCYGSGSVSEAFVRLCAVHGAVTVLRQPVQGLVVEAAGTAAAAAAAAGADADAGAVDEAAATSASEGGGAGAASASSAAAASASGRKCIGVVTAAGQLVRCMTLVAGVGTLSCLDGASLSPPPPAVSRAVVLLDGSLLPPPPPSPAPGAAAAAGGTSASAAPAQAPAPRAPPPPSLITLVVPPRSEGTAAAAAPASAAPSAWQPGGLDNPHPVRLLQMGASTCVCPPGRYLLYLSTPATSRTSYDDLHRTLAALVDTNGLTDAPSTSPSSSSGAAAVPAAEGPAAESADDAAAAGQATPPRPCALRAWFYRQALLHNAAAGGDGGDGTGGAAAGLHLPAGVVALPGPDGALVGWSGVLAATEAACRAAFPDVPWLSEVDFTPQDDADGEGGAAAGGGDEDDDAIDALSAAVAALQGAGASQPGPAAAPSS